MPLDATPLPRALAPATPPSPIAPTRPPFWRGAAGALALAGWTIAGVVWAALALAPVALERGPRGRARARPLLAARSPRAASPERSAPDEADAPDPVPAARAAGEAFPG